jgi:hypothetical protein
MKTAADITKTSKGHFSKLAKRPSMVKYQFDALQRQEKRRLSSLIECLHSAVEASQQIVQSPDLKAEEPIEMPSLTGCHRNKAEGILQPEVPKRRRAKMSRRNSFVIPKGMSLCHFNLIGDIPTRPGYSKDRQENVSSLVSLLGSSILSKQANEPSSVLQHELTNMTL